MQVRCIAAVLLMVGRGEEEPAVVPALLDVHQTPSKPTYVMASDEPLLLYHCGYEGLQFRRSPINYASVLTRLEQVMSRQVFCSWLFFFFF